MSENQTIASDIVDPNKLVDPVKLKYRFKKDKLDNQRASIEVDAVVPSFEGIVEILKNANTEEGKKEYELLRDCMYEAVRTAGLEKVSNDEKITSDNFPFAEITWKAIANQDRADRRASSIPAELWEACMADYVAIMPGLTGKSVDAVVNATAVYLKKFSQIKTDKKSLAKLQEQLGIYMQNTKKGEEFSEILELLGRKVESFLKADDIEQLVANL